MKASSPKKSVSELIIANKELAFQMEEKEKQASELIIANKGLVFQKEENEKLLAELIIANKELVFQNERKGKVESPLLENESSFYTSSGGPSEQKKAENALKESVDSEKRYNMMLMKSPFAFAVLKGKNMVINLANDSVKEMWGKGKDLEGKPILEVLPELKDSEFPGLLDNVYTTGIPYTGEELPAPVFRNGKLEDVYFNFVYQPYLEADETISGVTVIAYEVTEQVIAKRKIEESEHRLRLATQTSGVGIWEWNVITNKIRWDAQMFRIYGVAPTADGLIEYSTWSNAVVTEDRADQERILQDTVRNLGSSKRSFKIIRASDGMLSDIEAIETVRANAEGNAEWVVGTNLDVTEQKQGSQYARSLIEASLDPLVTISADGKITDVNEASIKVTGVEREKLIGTDFSNYFTEPQKAQEGYQQVFEKSFVADYPLTIKHKNGNLTDVLYNASVYKDDKGNVLGVFAAARDVTAQKQASQYARSLIEASLDPLVTISADGKITDVNEASIKVTGVEREKLIGTDFSNYFTEPQKAQEGYQQVFEKSFVADYPLTIKHKNGNLTDVLYNASVYKDDKGNVLGVFAAARDITARKKAEEKIKESEVEVRKIKEQLELSITAGKIGVWHWDVKNDLLYWSKEQHEIYGFDTSETVTNSAQFNALIVSGDLKHIQDDQSEGNKLEHEYDFQINRKNDGELRWIKSRAKNTFDSQGVLQHISGVNIDITEQKLFEGKLIEAKTFAENAAKSRQQFLSNMSHEIRTPMNSIIGFTNVVLKTDLNKEQKEFINAIKVSGDALLVLINDILDLAKVDAGKMTFEQTPFNLFDSISDMLHVFGHKVLEKNLELIKEYDHAIPEVLEGDSMRLRQIILNLVSNAVKFTEEGKITLSICMLKEDEEKVTIEFAVTDTGIGIPENKLEHIFEDFGQVSYEDAKLLGGTGLGLAIVKQLVEYQGGRVAVKSKIAKGSTFSFTLSFKKTTTTTTTTTSTSTSTTATSINEVELAELIKNIKVLVVEDIRLNQLLIKTILMDFGFQFDIADNGKIAIEKLQQNNYDIILMDLQMPEMNGFEATEYIRNKMNSQIPIIALTADVTTMDVEKSKTIGMNDFISKPIDEKLLYNKMIKYLKKSD